MIYLPQYVPVVVLNDFVASHSAPFPISWLFQKVKGLALSKDAENGDAASQKTSTL